MSDYYEFTVVFECPDCGHPSQLEAEFKIDNRVFHVVSPNDAEVECWECDSTFNVRSNLQIETDCKVWKPKKESK